MLTKNGFGLWSECPNDVRAAWGARAILKDGYVDLLWDRQGGAGEEDDRVVFCKRVDKVLPVVRAKVKELCSAWRGMDPTKSELFVLYEDEGICVKGNTNGSYGYLYLIAYPKNWDHVLNDPSPEVPKSPKEKKARKAKRNKYDKPCRFYW